MATVKQTYKQLLSITTSDKESADVSFKSENAALQLASDILATRKAITEATQAVANAKGAYPFNSESIKTAEIKLEGLSDGLKRLQAYEKELFPSA